MSSGEPQTQARRGELQTSPLRRALATALSAEVVRLGLRTSLVVGTVLNLINQGDALLEPKRIVIGKLLLTYLVPYGVVTYSATSVVLRLKADETPREGSIENPELTNTHSAP